jgi:hypothetical protein
MNGRTPRHQSAVQAPLPTGATPEKLAYAAGLFEGEGSVTAQVVSRLRQDGSRYVKPSRYPKARLKMTDPEPVAYMHEMFGGTLRGPFLQSERSKACYEWCLSGEAGVRMLYAAIGKWLSPRRHAQFRAAIARQLPPWRGRQVKAVSKGQA